MLLLCFLINVMHWLFYKHNSQLGSDDCSSFRNVFDANGGSYFVDLFVAAYKEGARKLERANSISSPSQSALNE